MSDTGCNSARQFGSSSLWTEESVAPRFCGDIAVLQESRYDVSSSDEEAGTDQEEEEEEDLVNVNNPWWCSMYQLAREYHEMHGNLSTLPNPYEECFMLPYWVSKQKDKLSIEGLLSHTQQQMLAQIGILPRPPQHLMNDNANNSLANNNHHPAPMDHSSRIIGDPLLQQETVKLPPPQLAHEGEGKGSQNDVTHVLDTWTSSSSSHGGTSKELRTHVKQPDPQLEQTDSHVAVDKKSHGKWKRKKESPSSSIDKWDKRFAKLRRYQLKHGTTCHDVSSHSSKKLHRWLRKQRKELQRARLGKPHSLSAERLGALEQLGVMPL
eukprot:scaffold52348_cov57-Attheya_sp.AAC.1